MSSTSFDISWRQIDCIERNGAITNYAIVIHKQGGMCRFPGEANVIDRTFTASGLTPHTNYTFSIAGVNSNGTGPFPMTLLFLLMKTVKYTMQYNFIISLCFYSSWCRV